MKDEAGLSGESSTGCWCVQSTKQEYRAVQLQAKGTSAEPVITVKPNAVYD
jgi:hypothetical protein